VSFALLFAVAATDFRPGQMIRLWWRQRRHVL